MTRHSGICSSPAAIHNSSNSSNPIAKSKACSARIIPRSGFHRYIGARPRNGGAEPGGTSTAARIECRLHKPKRAFEEALPSLIKSGTPDKTVSVQLNGDRATLGHGTVVISAITSCTNTSNPSVLIGAGLLAKKASEKGLKTKPWVKTSLAPGSKVVTEYLKESGLLPELEKLGFYLVGYGCTTCIGNAGPLPEPISAGIQEGDLVACAVLSGNRNFRGRIHPQVRANYLASPPLVVAYALAGRMDMDLTTRRWGKINREIRFTERYLADAGGNSSGDRQVGQIRDVQERVQRSFSRATNAGKNADT